MSEKLAREYSAEQTRAGVIAVLFDDSLATIPVWQHYWQKSEAASAYQ